MKTLTLFLVCLPTFAQHFQPENAAVARRSHPGASSMIEGPCAQKIGREEPMAIQS
jgi:hypothetical protein